jgi:multimeric flavodoxin WrbA
LLSTNLVELLFLVVDDLLASDAVVVGSPVYFGNMSGEVKSFFDNWLKLGLFQERQHAQQSWSRIRHRRGHLEWQRTNRGRNALGHASIK